MSETPNFTKAELRVLSALVRDCREHVNRRVARMSEAEFHFPNPQASVESAIVEAKKDQAIYDKLAAKIDALLAVPR